MTYDKMSMASLLDASMDSRRGIVERLYISEIVLTRLPHWDGLRTDLDDRQRRRLDELCRRESYAGVRRPHRDALVASR